MADHEQIHFDPSDLKGMKALMGQYGDSQSMILGTNENGEDVTISIFHDKIITVTYQSNGWIRKNVYHWDNSREELFEGRWIGPGMTEPQLG